MTLQSTQLPKKFSKHVVHIRKDIYRKRVEIQKLDTEAKLHFTYTCHEGEKRYRRIDNSIFEVFVSTKFYTKFLTTVEKQFYLLGFKLSIGWRNPTSSFREKQI